MRGSVEACLPNVRSMSHSRVAHSSSLSAMHGAPSFLMTSLGSASRYSGNRTAFASLVMSLVEPELVFHLLIVHRGEDKAAIGRSQTLRERFLTFFEQKYLLNNIPAQSFQQQRVSSTLFLVIFLAKRAPCRCHCLELTSASVRLVVITVFFFLLVAIIIQHWIDVSELFVRFM